MNEIGKAVRALIKARLEVVETDMPEHDSKVAVRLLSDSEIAEANVDAYADVARRCREKNVDVARYIEADRDAFERAQIHQMIVRAFRVHDDHAKPLFEGADHLRTLDASYVNALYNVYLTHQEVKAPRKTLDDDAVPGAIAAMMENADLELALSQIEAGSLVRMVRYLLGLARTKAD